MWNFRPGTNPQEQLQELEKTFGLANLRDIPIETAFPAAGPQETIIKIVLSSGTYYVVVLTAGIRLRVALTQF